MPAIDLLPGEFRHPSITPGVHEVSIGVSGHEHAIGSGLDVERGTITCQVCKTAVEEEAKGHDARRIVVGISAETFFALKQASKGKSVENFAAELLSRPEKR
jgi:hypothetical protein